MAEDREDSSTPGDKDIDNIGTHVKVEDAGLDLDLSQGFVEPTKGLYVREAFASFVRQVEPGNEGVIGKGMRYVKPVSPRRLANYAVAVLVRAIGTSGMLVKTSTFNRQKVVEYYQYLRPTAKHANTVMQAVALIRELANRGVPWTALAIVYPGPNTKLKKPMVLQVKGIWAYYRRIHTSAGIRYSPDVRFYFTRQVLGLRKGASYLFDFIIMYSSKPLQKPPSRQELLEKAMAQTPPPRLVLAQAPKAQAPGKYAKAHVRAVEAQPTVQAPPLPQVQVVPEQPQAQPTPQTAVQTAPQPTPQPAVQTKPAPQTAPQTRPATISTGNYVKQDLSFVKEIVSLKPGEAFRALRERRKKNYVSGV